MRWAGVTLVAGPERLPPSEALARLGEPGTPTLLLSLRPHALSELEVWNLHSGGVDRVQSWLDGVEGAARVVLDGVDAAGSVWPGELPEAALLRFLDALRLRAGVSVVLLEPFPVDRLAAPSAAMARLLGRVDQVLLWTGDAVLDGREVLTSRAHPAIPRDAFASERWLYAAIAAACVVVCLVAFRPSLLGGFRGVGLLGSVGEDLPRSLWLNAWLGERFAEGGSWNDTARVYWPLGAEVVAIVGNLGAALLAQPFQLLLGFPGYWNTYLAAALVGNGLAMGWLARTAGADRVGTMLGALSFTLAPPLMLELSRGDPRVLWAFPVPLAVGMALRALDGGRREAVLAGLAVALASLIWWFHALFAGLIIGALWLTRLRVDRAGRSRLMGQLGLMFKVWLPSLVTAIPLLAAANRGHLPDIDELYLPGRAGPSFAASLAFSRMTQDVLPLDRLLAVPSASAGWFASVLVLALVVGWLLAYGGQRLFWLGLAAAFGVLALGPWLSPSWGMSESWLPLPLRAFQVLFPPLVALDRPDRLLIVSGLALALTLALAWAPLSLRIPARMRTTALGGALFGIGAMPVLSGALPLPVFDYAAPSWVTEISGEGAVIHVPLGWSESSILWQPLHGLDVTGGPDEVQALRDPTPYRTTFDDTPALAFFRDLQRGRMGTPERAWLKEHGATWIVVHTSFIKQLIRSSEGPEIDALEPLLDRIDVAFGPAVFADESVRLYRVR